MVRLANIWTLGALSLLLIATSCDNLVVGAVGPTENETNLVPADQNSHKRESRGILLRSWRNIQTRAKEQQPQSSPTENINYQKPAMPIMLSSLPITMKLALLQRMTGHDKRAPNSRAFLGMRGKKDGEDHSILESWRSAEEDQDGSRIKKPFGIDRFVGTRGKKDPLGSRFYGVRGKKIPNKFLGMRGKKSDAQVLLAGDADPLKRSNILHSFVGMRGKKEFDDVDETSDEWPDSFEIDPYAEDDSPTYGSNQPAPIDTEGGQQD